MKSLRTLRGISVKPITKTDVDALAQLQMEFGNYLKQLDKRRVLKKSTFYKERLRKYAFGNGRAFNGFIAKNNGQPVGYVYYHLGYDPDEMEGLVLYVIDLYVTNSERNRGIGSQLMRAVASTCKQIDGIDIYFGVWKRNLSAQKFYKKLGATMVQDVPFMHWKKSKWN